MADLTPAKKIAKKLTPRQAKDAEIARRTEAALQKREKMIVAMADRAAKVVDKIMGDKDEAARDRLAAAKLALQMDGRLTERRQVEHTGTAKVVVVPGTMPMDQWTEESRRVIGGGS